MAAAILSTVWSNWRLCPARLGTPGRTHGSDRSLASATSPDARSVGAVLDEAGQGPAHGIERRTAAPPLAQRARGEQGEHGQSRPRGPGAQHEQGRQAFFDEVLTGWSTEELRQFARQLERFTAAYDHVHTAWTGGRAGHPDSRPNLEEDPNA